MRWYRRRVVRDGDVVRFEVEFMEGDVAVAGYEFPLDFDAAAALGTELLAAAGEIGAAGQERQRQQPTLRRGH